MSEPQEVFTSRRERREAERSSNLRPETFSDLTQDSAEVIPASGQKTEYPPTAVDTSGFEIQQTMPQSYRTRREELGSNRETFLEPTGPLSFESATNLGTEPISASIVINHVPDLENNVMVIPETGDFLRTGSIELPKLDTSTGGVSMIMEGQAADEAIVEDSLNSFVSSVAPLRATGLAKSRSKAVEVALTSRSGQGHVYAVMSTAVLMITVGALVVAAFLLGIFE